MLLMTQMTQTHAGPVILSRQAYDKLLAIVTELTYGHSPEDVAYMADDLKDILEEAGGES